MCALENNESDYTEKPALRVIEQSEPLSFEEFIALNPKNISHLHRRFNNILFHFNKDMKNTYNIWTQAEHFQKLKEIDPDLLEETTKLVTQNYKSIFESFENTTLLTKENEFTLRLVYECYLIMREFTPDQELFA